MGIIVLRRGVEISTCADPKTILFHQQNPPQSPQQIKTHGALYQKSSKPSSRTIPHSPRHLCAEKRRKRRSKGIIIVTSYLRSNDICKRGPSY